MEEGQDDRGHAAPGRLALARWGTLEPCQDGDPAGGGEARPTDEAGCGSARYEGKGTAQGGPACITSLGSTAGRGQGQPGARVCYRARNRVLRGGRSLPVRRREGPVGI